MGDHSFTRSSLNTGKRTLEMQVTQKRNTKTEPLEPKQKHRLGTVYLSSYYIVVLSIFCDALTHILDV